MPGVGNLFTIMGRKNNLFNPKIQPLSNNGDKGFSLHNI